MSKTPSSKYPLFDDLPLDKSGPPGNAWGLYGDNDQLGRLNLLTPATVAAAAAEIKEGVRVSLDWPLDKPTFPTFERQRFEHRILNKAPMTMNDDAVSLNTQSSTQWDGFRHYGLLAQLHDSIEISLELKHGEPGYQRAQKFYNGRTQQDFERGLDLGINGTSFLPTCQTRSSRTSAY